eukprot:4340231-Alexandrium_andersonii.AAC.1
MCIRDRLGICRNSEPRSPKAGARGAALRAAPPALRSAIGGFQNPSDSEPRRGPLARWASWDRDLS